MKVSSGDLLKQYIQGLQQGGKNAAQGQATGSDPFSAFLETAIQKDEDGRTLIIDREKLALMLELVRVQMNQAVLSSLAGDEAGNSTGSIDFMVSIPDIQPAPQQESKIRRSEPSPMPDQGVGDMNAVIDKASRTYGVDRDLITSVIRAESDFDANAASPKGAMGLMQLMPATAQDLGVKNPYDPEENVMAGTRHLKYLLDRYHGNASLALAAYNWGTGNLERSTGNLPEETRNYIAKIMKSYGRSEG